VAQFGEVAVSAPREAAQHILNSGSIKTQFETLRSQGAFNPSLRHVAEKGMGYDYEAPVYGYFRRSEGEEAPYGNVDFRLDSSVKQRAAMHPGDSLNDYARGKDLEPQNAGEVARGEADAPEPNSWSSYEDVDYVEAHIGSDPSRPETVAKAAARGDRDAARVPLSDVRSMVIGEGSLRFDLDGSRRNADRPKNFELGRQASKMGISVEHSLTDLVEQPTLPMAYNDGPQPSSEFSTRKRLVRHGDLSTHERWGGH
jgi:hypothetical protein